jgi:hypothetical protein
MIQVCIIYPITIIALQMIIHILIPVVMMMSRVLAVACQHQARAAEYSSSEDDDSVVSVDNNEDDDSISFQGSVMSTCNNDDAITAPKQSPTGFTQDAFEYNTMVPSPLPTSIHVVPPVSCVLVPNDPDDISSSVAAPISERIDPAGRVPIRIQQDTFRHVDDIVYHKPSLMTIGGEAAHNWARFTDTQRSFPTQVTVSQRILLDSGARLAISDLPNAFLWQFQPKKAGVIRGHGSIDPPDFQQG